MDEAAVKATFSAFAVQVGFKAEGLELFLGSVINPKPRHQQYQQQELLKTVQGLQSYWPKMHINRH